MGELIDAPLSGDAPWSAAGTTNLDMVQAIYQLVNGKLWLPQMQEQDVRLLPMTSLQRVCRVGNTDNNIVGNGSQTAFVRIKPPSSAPAYPMRGGMRRSLRSAW